MIQVQITIGAQFSEKEVREFSGHEDISADDVNEFVADRYGEGLGCDTQILGSDVELA